MINFNQESFEAITDGGTTKKWVARAAFDFDLDDAEELDQLVSLLEVARHFVDYNTRTDNGLESTIAAMKVLALRAGERQANSDAAVLLPGEERSKP